MLRLEKTGVITKLEREAYEKKDLQLKVEDFAKRYPWIVTQAIGHIPDEYLEVGLQNKSIYSTIHPTYQRIAEKKQSLSGLANSKRTSEKQRGSNCTIVPLMQEQEMYWLWSVVETINYLSLTERRKQIVPLAL